MTDKLATPLTDELMRRAKIDPHEARHVWPLAARMERDRAMLRLLIEGFLSYGVAISTSNASDLDKNGFLLHSERARAALAATEDKT